MNREEAHQFIQLYEKFMLLAGEDVKISDIDPATHEIELDICGDYREWFSYQDAAKVIEDIVLAVPHCCRDH